MINIGGGRQRLMTEERNCGRIIWDSRDMVARVWKRIEHLPEVQEITRLENVPRIFGNGPAKWQEVWKFTRPNERMRFLKYEGQEYFRPHCDGSYETPDHKERTYFTLHLYLNNAGVATKDPKDASEGDAASGDVLIGGATTFHAYVSAKRLQSTTDRADLLAQNMVDRLDVLPKAGRILLFQHRDLIHSGDDVIAGTKYTMRTDLLYSLEEGEPRQRGKQQQKKSKMPVLHDPVEEEEGTDGLSEAQEYGYLN